MNINPASESSSNPIKQPEHVAAGVFANAAVVSNTQEEFFLDFLATYATPLRLVARVILHPSHLKRLLKVLRENLEAYRQNFGPLPDLPPQPVTNQNQVQDLYAQLSIPDPLMGGTYANGVLIRHTQEEFVLDFLVVTQPMPVLTARVLVSPAHIQRIANALEERVKGFEAAGGSAAKPPGDTEPPEPPAKPRFSLS